MNLLYLLIIFLSQLIFFKSDLCKICLICVGCVVIFILEVLSTLFFESSCLLFNFHFNSQFFSFILERVDKTRVLNLWRLMLSFSWPVESWKIFFGLGILSFGSERNISTQLTISLLKLNNHSVQLIDSPLIV